MNIKPLELTIDKIDGYYGLSILEVSNYIGDRSLLSIWLQTSDKCLIVDILFMRFVIDW